MQSRTMARVSAYTAAFLKNGDDLVTAKAKALAALGGATATQASVMSFNDTFHATAMLIVMTLPLVFLLGKGGKGPVDAGH